MPRTIQTNSTIRFRSALACLLSLAAMTATFSVSAAEDSDAFKAIYEKEWAFRLEENPTFASWVGKDEFADQLGSESEEDNARRAAYWKGIRKELDGISKSFSNS